MNDDRPDERGDRRVRTRLGVNLCWLDPGTVGGSEEAITRVLRTLADRQDDGHDVDVDVVLFVLDAFTEAHPDLVAAFETHVLTLPGRLKPLRVLAEYSWLPLMVRRHRIDVLHDAGGTCPGAVGCPRVLTIHDIQPLDLPENFGRVRVTYLRRALPDAVRKATHVLVPSDFVRSRVIDRLGVAAARVSVAPWSTPPVGDGVSAEVMRAGLGLAGPYLLVAGITYPHKDHATALRALHRLAGRHPDLRMVFAGGRGPAEDAVVDQIATLGLDERIVRPGRVDAPIMATLIAEAAAVLVPSRYEGFGIPALEAMAAGVPAVVSDAGSLPEVVGDGGVVIGAGDDAQWAIEIHRILSDGAHRDAVAARGQVRAEAFTPGLAVDRFLAGCRSAARGQ